MCTWRVGFIGFERLKGVGKREVITRGAGMN